ncbi:MAG: hypothetical protein J7L14_01505 [Candidatus Diapherotrites archaeon]|nr:hypothetical protein [Candidatus Diapherotrites archaeon]
MISEKTLRATANRIFSMLSRDIKTASLTDEERQEYESLEEILEKGGIRIRNRPLHIRLQILLNSGLLNKTNSKECCRLYEFLSEFQRLVDARHSRVYGREFDELVGYLLGIFSTRGISSREFREGFKRALALKEAIETARKLRHPEYARKAREVEQRERNEAMKFLRRRRPV